MPEFRTVDIGGVQYATRGRRRWMAMVRANDEQSKTLAPLRHALLPKLRARSVYGTPSGSFRRAQRDT
jgi:hypothetical protein